MSALSFPLVSVYIPSFNHEKYVVDALNSVVRQDYDNVELVLIDDASTDGSWELIKSWAAANSGEIAVKIFRHERNQGITKTLNELIDLCSGEYLVGIASDDYLLPGSIAKRVNYLEENPNKGAVFGDCVVVNEKGDVLHYSGLSELYSMDRSKLCGPQLEKELIINWGVPGGTLMVRRDVHEKIKFDTRLLVEDFDFYLKLLAEQLLGYLDESVSAYRLHESNTSRARTFSVRRKIDFLRSVSNNIWLFSPHCWPWFVRALINRI